jgi:hypothetical protein
MGMKKIYMSTIAAAMLTTGALAESNTIAEAFANGKASGDISVYAESVSKSGTNKDSGISMTSIGLNYETDSINGFKANLGFRSNHKINEKESGDYDNGTSPSAVLSTANISYATDKAAIIVGRQEIDLEWIGDYHEAVVGVLNYVPDTTIVVGHTTRFMEVNSDEALQNMGEFGTNNNGATVIDAKYEGIKNTVINPYVMDVKDTFSAYGLKATTSISGIDLTAHYAATNEDVTGTNDGSIAHLEIGTTVSDITLAAGYATTDKDGGAGSITAIGDNIDPFEDGGDIYGTDADTFYVSVAGDVSSVSLSAFYGTTESGATNADNSEIVLTAGTPITDNLSLDLLISSIDAQNSTNDADKVTVMATYSF